MVASLLLSALFPPLSVGHQSLIAGLPLRVWIHIHPGLSHPLYPTDDWAAAMEGVFIQFAHPPLPIREVVVPEESGTSCGSHPQIPSGTVLLCVCQIHTPLEKSLQETWYCGSVYGVLSVSIEVEFGWRKVNALMTLFKGLLKMFGNRL